MGKAVLEESVDLGVGFFGRGVGVAVGHGDAVLRAEEMVDGGGSPTIEHIEVNQATKTADMLRADIKIEQEVAAEYDRAAKEAEDADLKKLLIRIRDNELYHVDIFSDLLKDEEK